MDIDTIIINSGFDEWDRDAATSFGCGTFALALKEALPDLELGLICLADKDGQAAYAKDGDPFWKHVVAVEGLRLFDVDGQVQLEDVIENYCWDNPYGKGGVLVHIEVDDLKALLVKDNKSFDQDRLHKWSEMLSEQVEIDRSQRIVVR